MTSTRGEEHISQAEQVADAKERHCRVDVPMNLEKQNQLDQIMPNTTTGELLPNNASVLTAYRRIVKDIVDAEIKKCGIKFSYSKGYSVRDRHAHQDGIRDARDIDIKRKRIEYGTFGNEIVGVGSRTKI